LSPDILLGLLLPVFRRSVVEFAVKKWAKWKIYVGEGFDRDRERESGKT
jgi:hypothetical protein